MKNIVLFLKGMIIGIGKIVPGVSGSVLAILLGLYDEGLEALGNITKRENILFLSLTGSGILLSIIYGSSILLFLLEKNYLRTMLLFCGLIFGTIPIIKREVNLKTKKRKLYFILFTLSLYSFLGQTSTSNYEFTYTCKDFFFFLLTGFIEASTMIIPGISGTAILMLLGVYQIVMETFSHLFSISYLAYNIRILIPFLLGFIIGFILVTKSIYYLLKHQKEKTYFMILIFSFTSFLLLVKKTFTYSFKIEELIIGSFYFIFGYFLSSFFSRKEEK